MACCRKPGDVRLDEWLTLYGMAVDIKDALVASSPDLFHASSSAGRSRARGSTSAPVFRPKSAADYTAHVGEQDQARTRKHEAVVGDFGTHVIARGFTPNTAVHPRDLVLRLGENEWLVEAKTVKANAELAVREAIGQLFTYRYFYYELAAEPLPNLVAVFSESVGGALVELLERLGIAAVWRDHGTWKGSISAVSDALVEGPEV